MPLQSLSWLLCCRQGFTLLRRDYGEKEEEEESFELRSKDELLSPGRDTLDVAVSQPLQAANGPSSVSEIPEEMRSLIIEKNKGTIEDDSSLLVKGWLYKEVHGTWLRQRKHWFVLTQDALEYYSSDERNAKRLGMLVLTSLCTVIWPDKQTYKETGYWNVAVYGRKLCYRLSTKHFNEAIHWACAIQKVIESKAPVETPTQLLIRDIEVTRPTQREVSSSNFYQRLQAVLF
ncbi:pleckstrin homology domain-containing family H member 3-like [Polypterus senegalus]|uniref:pleckstrin homology domain-containing family H member 3-like n=1 Tax=Polypterus senegalus TaxID=55291 RepID=UPI001962D6F3|nr:pleckstrin homology domain-containing family H member 3-like [Polypterus senegalus]